MNPNNPRKVVGQTLVKKILKTRDPNSHKGDYGHACIIAGSIGLMGAAVLSVKACLRAGPGKVTAFAPVIGYDIMQITAPEAMIKIAGHNFIDNVGNLQKYDCVGIGPGLGLYESHKYLLQNVFSSFKRPIVIDADALNVLAQKKDLLEKLPEASIITPHHVEFERLFGSTENEDQKIKLALEISHKYKIYIILKGHHTKMVTPDKNVWYNTTGNAGMATGGSGDVLTGIITGLLARGYSSFESGVLGVYIHGLAGDIAADQHSQESMIAGDIVKCLGKAFKTIRK